jgi:hypothetical protein
METKPIDDQELNSKDVKSDIVDSNDELKEFQDELVELQSELKVVENQIKQNKGGDNGIFKELMAMKAELKKHILEVEMDIEFIQTSNK